MRNNLEVSVTLRRRVAMMVSSKVRVLAEWPPVVMEFELYEDQTCPLCELWSETSMPQRAPDSCACPDASHFMEIPAGGSVLLALPTLLENHLVPGKYQVRAIYTSHWESSVTQELRSKPVQIVIPEP